MDIHLLKYPLGQYEPPTEITKDIFNGWIKILKTLPKDLKELIGNLSYNELKLQYRPGGWNIKQVVHHLADSHMNSFIRFKWIITEDNPTIKTYIEDEWAKTADADSDEITGSIEILDGLHNRIVILLNSLKDKQKKRTFIHPEYDQKFTLEWMLGSYAWHSTHHLAHIKQALKIGSQFTSKKINE